MSKKPKATWTVIIDFPSKNPVPGVITIGGEQKSTPEGLPSKLKILGADYSIVYMTNIYDPSGKKPARLYGCVNFDYRTIFIDPSFSTHHMKQVIGHEIAHIYLQDAQSRSKEMHKLTHAQVEEYCDIFGESLYDFVANNPKL